MSAGPTGYQGYNGQQGPKGDQGPDGKPGYGYNVDVNSIRYYGGFTGPTGPIGFFTGTQTAPLNFDLSSAQVGVLYVIDGVVNLHNSGTRTVGQHYTFINPGPTQSIYFDADTRVDMLNENIPGSAFSYSVPNNGFLRLIWDGSKFWTFTK